MIPVVNYVHDSIYSWFQKKNLTKNYRCAPNKSMQNVKERHINSMISFFCEFIWNLVKWLEFLFHSKNWGLFRKSRGHAIISFAIKTIEFVFVLVLASIRFMSVRIYWIQVVDKYIILRQAKWDSFSICQSRWSSANAQETRFNRTEYYIAWLPILATLTSLILRCYFFSVLLRVLLPLLLLSQLHAWST